MNIPVSRKLPLFYFFLLQHLSIFYASFLQFFANFQTAGVFLTGKKKKIVLVAGRGRNG
jgi:hypothetical protein